MSELTTAARPYARAAFDIATTHGEQQQWTDMLEFMAAVAYDTSMTLLLDSPGLSQAQAAEMFILVCEEKLDQRAKNFIKLLAENDRIKLLPEIAALYEHYRADAEGSIDAEMISANETNEEQLAKIAAALKARIGKEVRLTSKIDPTLIGGAIIRAGDMVIDGSLSGQLRKLSTTLTHYYKHWVH
ncbi:MAG: F0F1 ATP synthase subunit delta [Gammaproteobacteria bacterium]